MDELYALKKPSAVKLSRTNDILPFEDESKLEFLAHKNDCSLFLLGNSTKKRPDNFVMGRLFDFHVLDMVEFGVSNFKSMHTFRGAAPGLGMRPCFVFCGDEFETVPEVKKLGNLYLDFFGGRATSMINLKGLESVVVLTAVEGVVYFRHYSVALNKSGTALPRVELSEVGPSFDMQVRRHKLAGDDVWKQATKKHALVAPRVKKNIEQDSLGQTLGTVHMTRQDLSALVTRKGKALRRGRDEEEEEQQQQQQQDDEGGDNDGAAAPVHDGGAGRKKPSKKHAKKLRVEATDM